MKHDANSCSDSAITPFPAGNAGLEHTHDAEGLAPRGVTDRACRLPRGSLYPAAHSIQDPPARRRELARAVQRSSPFALSVRRSRGVEACQFVTVCAIAAAPFDRLRANGGRRRIVASPTPKNYQTCATRRRRPRGPSQAGIRVRRAYRPGCRTHSCSGL